MQQPARTQTFDGVESNAERLGRLYGELVGLDALVHVLHYPSVSALRRANERGTLPIALRKIPGRRGLFALRRELAAWLDQLDTYPAPGGAMKP